MVDTGTGLTLLAPSALMLKVLGPTADYVGEGIQQWSERRVRNVNNVFAKAARKLGGERLEEAGSVPPKVLKGVLEEASFCDDELTAEYLGGVLASSRGEVSRDDRAVTLVAQVARLSTYQLRSHYVMYSSAQRALEGANLDLGDAKVRRLRGAFFLAGSFWESAMDFSEHEQEPDQFHSILEHVVNGLGREELIEREIISVGGKEVLNKAFDREFPTHGIAYCVSTPGIELFTAAHGVAGMATERFQGSSGQFTVENKQDLCRDVMAVAELPGL